MNCANHPETVAAAYCRTCGKPLCVECKREANGTIYCAEHVPVPASSSARYTAPPTVSSGAVPPGASPYTAPLNDGGPAPFLAFLLGFIPGVGAIYNGQYAKGLIHAVIFGILVSIIDHGRGSAIGPLIGIFLAAWIFYMAFEAFHTARNRRNGMPVEENSSLFTVDRTSGRFPFGAVILIVIGGMLLLDTTNLISIDRLLRFSPAGLILIGAYLLYQRLSTAPHQTGVPHDRR